MVTVDVFSERQRQKLALTAGYVLCDFRRFHLVALVDERNRLPRVGIPAGGEALRLGFVLLGLGADDPSGHADPFVDDDVETVAGLVGPDDADLVPEAFLVGAFLRLADNIGSM